MSIGVLDYGMGNLRSVARAIEHVGGTAEIVEDPGAVQRAEALVVPGVGHFGACVRNLRDRGLDQAIRSVAGAGRPVFGVCVGMQVLLEGSEEDPDPGIGLLAGRCRRLPSSASVKVPHMGWNTVAWSAGAHPYLAGVPDGSRFYFVHSFAPDPGPSTLGVAEHGRTFSAVVASANVFATQFHPEKSGSAGLALYEAFVKEAAG
ncbi:MAG TPA: imidazole glycerol phosphate synthase subunit HisH [Actinomycetota bacterium]|nr:imidazole glycerol phosphate synthase subunit HisH [Actinomycetota bacterium]